jgi:hypothetical protein
MKQTVTIEIEDTAAMQLLRDLAAMNIIRIITEKDADKVQRIALFNEIFDKEDASLEPCFVMAQAEVYGKEDWC